jgi:hypothetical protein
VETCRTPRTALATCTDSRCASSDVVFPDSSTTPLFTDATLMPLALTRWLAFERCLDVLLDRFVRALDEGALRLRHHLEEVPDLLGAVDAPRDVLCLGFFHLYRHLAVQRHDAVHGVDVEVRGMDAIRRISATFVFIVTHAFGVPALPTPVAKIPKARINPVTRAIRESRPFLNSAVLKFTVPTWRCRLPTKCG